MHRTINNLPVNLRWKMVVSLNKIISEESRRQELMGKFNKASLQYNTVAPAPGQRRRKLRSVNYGAMARLKQDLAKSYTNSPAVNVSKIKSIQGQDQFPQRRKVSDTNRSTWDMAFKERPGPVILTAHYPDIGNRVVNRAGRSYKDVLDEKVNVYKGLQKYESENKRGT